ncbi:SDR family NAD(P)-dependent oxidoreductase [Yinghuangia seranimata]|uniref:SDR family NAD(P)-dependent oxidoreductase n=1 Tax=Yinghuangia seranimata TaxID=408067 RepID=UPI00248AAFEF|nr:glucose 1-dehydrogenase [Yinghuangia seranimata]MDI2132696.1 glucose 1-dehydrogenase [Yinghuangia seranimata]
MSARFTGKVVLVTGGGTGIGRAAARGFAAEGATVVVAGRTEAGLEETVALIEKDGGKADHVVADVTSENDVEGLVRAVVERHGGLHVAFNNAGAFGPSGPVGELDADAFRALLDVNVMGVFLAMKHEIAHMKAHGGGAIVNIASNIGTHRRLPGAAAYATSKAAVAVLTRAAAADHIQDGVRINTVSPGASDGPMSYRPGETREDRDARLASSIPLGRVGSLDEITAAVLYLASDEAGFTVGADLVLDGGVTA